MPSIFSNATKTKCDKMFLPHLQQCLIAPCMPKCHSCVFQMQAKPNVKKMFLQLWQQGLHCDVPNCFCCAKHFLLCNKNQGRQKVPAKLAMLTDGALVCQAFCPMQPKPNVTKCSCHICNSVSLHLACQIVTHVFFRCRQNQM